MSNYTITGQTAIIDKPDYNPGQGVVENGANLNLLSPSFTYTNITDNCKDSEGVDRLSELVPNDEDIAIEILFTCIQKDCQQYRKFFFKNRNLEGVSIEDEIEYHIDNHSVLGEFTKST